MAGYREADMQQWCYRLDITNRRERPSRPHLHYHAAGKTRSGVNYKEKKRGEEWRITHVNVLTTVVAAAERIQTQDDSPCD